MGKPPILPSNQNPRGSLYATRPGALPARFRRQRLLIIGCGDVGLRVAQALPTRVRVLALTSSANRIASLGSFSNSGSLVLVDSTALSITGPVTTTAAFSGWPVWPTACCTWRRRRAKAGTTRAPWR